MRDFRSHWRDGNWRVSRAVTVKGNMKGVRDNRNSELELDYTIVYSA